MGQPLIHVQSGLTNLVLMVSPVTRPLMTRWFAPYNAHADQTDHARVVFLCFLGMQGLFT